MSTGQQMRLEDATDLARQIAEAFAPVVERCKVAGSVRRRRPMISDIELLVEPKKVQKDLFGGEGYDFEAIVEKARSIGEIVKGAKEEGRDSYSPRYIKISNVLGSSASLDVFIVYEPSNWWCQLAIRTGPADLGKLCVTRLRLFRMKHEDGRIIDFNGQVVPVESEFDFFNYARMPYLKPFLRDTRDAFTPLPASDEAKALLKRACEE